jgi:hypothetical protein
MLAQIVLVGDALFGLGYTNLVAKLSRDCEVRVLSTATIVRCGRGGHDIAVSGISPAPDKNVCGPDCSERPTVLRPCRRCRQLRHYHRISPPLCPDTGRISPEIRCLCRRTRPSATRPDCPPLRDGRTARTAPRRTVPAPARRPHKNPEAVRPDRAEHLPANHRLITVCRGRP